VSTSVCSEKHGVVEVGFAGVSPSKTSITVIDHGSGMAKNKLALPFQPLTKVEGTETLNHEGMVFSLYPDRLIMTYIGDGTIVSNSTNGIMMVRLDILLQIYPAEATSSS